MLGSHDLRRENVAVQKNGKDIGEEAASSKNQSTRDGKSKVEKKVELERTLTVWNGVSVILGVMIGSGIFVSPQGVLQETGSIGASLVVWTLCGILAMFGALCFAELGTSITTSGGEYTYLKLAYGPLLSFLYLWVLVLIILPCSNAIASLTFANYILQPLYVGCEPPQQSVRLLALALILILAFINCASVRSSIKIQNSFTMAKVISLILIITYGLYYVIAGKAESLYTMESIWSGTETSLPHLATAFYATFYTYSGWNSLNCVAEEIKDPVKNIPRAIMISIVCITVIYTLTNVAYFSVLSKEDMLSSQAIAVLFGDKVLTFARWLMPVLVALSTMGGLNGSIFASSRILFAGARSGQLFSALSMIHLDYLTPIPAILFLALTSCAYLFTTTIIIELINYTTFVEATFAALGVSTMLILRYKLPNLNRPLKIHWSVPVLYLLFSVLLIVLPFWNSPIRALIGVAILLTGIPVYYLTAAWETKPPSYQRAIDRFNLIIQKITRTVEPTRDTDLLI